MTTEEIIAIDNHISQTGYTFKQRRGGYEYKAAQPLIRRVLFASGFECYLNEIMSDENGVEYTVADVKFLHNRFALVTLVRLPEPPEAI